MKKGASVGIYLAMFAAFFGQTLVAQGYRIEATFKGLKDTTAILGHYKFNGQQFFAKDTARSDANGRMVFEGDESLPGGLYMILLPGPQKLVQLVYSGQETNFSVKTDTSSIIQSMVVKGSEENRIFYNYQQELVSLSEQASALDIEKRLKADEPGKTSLNMNLIDLQQKVAAYQKKFLAENGNTFTAKLLKAAKEPEIPPAPVLANGQKDSVWVFNYYKNHFWDHFDFKDERMIRTPFLQPKLERYVKELIVQVPDSIIKDADAMVKKATAAGNKDLRSQIIWYITSEYENPKVVGTEGVFVHMAEQYYLSGEMNVSQDAVNRIRERVTSMKPLLVNQIIPDLILSDPEKKPVSIHGIRADYTVVSLYSLMTLREILSVNGLH